MTNQEHLLVVLIEELAELQKDLSKALRFGMDDVNPATGKANDESIIIEMNDVLAMLEMNGFLKFKDQGMMETKKAKVERFLKYSKDKGTLK